MWQICQNLLTKKKLKSDCFLEICQHALIHQSPKPDLHGSGQTLYTDKTTTLHPTLIYYQILLQPITYRVINYDYQDIHH